ncbi:Uncharacterized protein TCM_023801 [Theobroma cacao]|uniref:Uncharacterized protein n=1 Tax=Theobroma cacao TaxID=3641 RepID=A0A061F2J9_THECC|nr:Uncharacterized protein TCM_023801 [Theobroma cacao]
MFHESSQLSFPSLDIQFEAGESTLECLLNTFGGCFQRSPSPLFPHSPPLKHDILLSYCASSCEIATKTTTLLRHYHLSFFLSVLSSLFLFHLRDFSLLSLQSSQDTCLSLSSTTSCCPVMLTCL